MNEVIELSKKLIKIPSVSGNKQEIFKAFEEIRSYLGESKAVIKEFTFSEDENAPVMLVSSTDSMDFNILALVHIDVVPASDESQFNPTIKDDKLFGRGACDMKTQTAIVLENLKYVLEKNISLNYGVLIVSDEETNSNSIKMFLKQNPQIKVDVLLDVDGGSLDNIIYKYKHPVTIKAFYNGKEGHSSRPWGGDNSINGLMDFINIIQESFHEYNKMQEPEDSWVDTMAITDFKTDFKASNTIPSYSETRISFRLTEKITYEELKEILDKAATESGGDYEVITHSKGLYMDRDNEIINKYKEIAEKITTQKVKLSHMHGATDSRFFSNMPNTKGGEATIIIHSINGDNIHGKEEYCTIDSVTKLSQIQKEFIESLVD